MRSFNMDKLNKWLNSLVMICLLVVTFGFTGVMDVYAASTNEIKVPYTHTYDADKTRTDDTFTYQIKPVSGAPAPNGSKDGVYYFKVKGVPGGNAKKGNVDLKIAFPRPGEYVYKVSSADKKKDGFTYESRTYDVHVFVKNAKNGGFNALVEVTSGNSKKERIQLNPSYKAQNVPGNQVRPTTTPAGNGAVAPAAPATPDGQPQDGEPVVEDDDDNTIIDDIQDALPKADPGRDYWALLNLLSAIVTVIIAAVLLKRYFERIDDEEDEYIIRREGKIRLVGLAPALASVILFFLTEDLSLPMEWVDEWTWAMLVILALGGLTAFASYWKYDRNNDEDNESGEGSADNRQSEGSPA